ncbi:MAG: response regulator [Alphaproteobacteria bacterium]|nr:response regulator [Alphaproteobacteria bacterium]
MANRPKVLAYEPDPAVSLSPLEGRFGVHAFQTVDDAIAGLTHLHPALVLVHLDEGGLELCRHVIERDPLMPVVLLATEVSTWSVVEGLRAGARDVVTLEGDWARTLTARIDDALGWRQLVERDAEAQVQSFMIQTELYQQQAKSLGGRVADLELQLRAEKALVTQTQQQLELQRELAMAAVRAKGAFLANMTHEIHTPLNAIIGYAEMLMEELPDQASEDASKIIASGQKLLKLLQDVLNLARLESGEVHPVFEPVLIGEIVDRCAKTVAAAAQKGGVTLQIELDPSVPEIVTDPRRLSEALAHILDNAVKFGAGGTVRVLTAARDGGLALTVEDEGIGFEPGDLERMLGAFNQIDDSDDRGFGGAGMGLAVANQLARVLGGRLEGQGEKGKGSRFTIWLPELDDSTVEEGSRRAVTVLVVDDDPVLRRVLQHMLVADGHSVVTTANPTEALELARLHHPSLVALDVLLPGTDGLTLLQQIKSDPELSRLPVVMLSATEDGGRAATLGACAFLHKPVTREKLREIIDTHALPPETSVVVVEGAPSSRGIADLLRGNGVVVEALANGGLRALPDHAQAVLVPLDLPVEQGLAVLDVLSGLRDIPVLACGEPASEAEQRFLESELAGVLRRDQLPDALRAVLRAR